MEKSINITDLKSGDYKAFENLFSKFYEPLCRYAYSILRSMDESEDAVQQVFYKLWDQHGALEIRTSINSYLYRMVHNACLNRVKQINLHGEHNNEYITEQNNIENNTESGLLTNELQERINAAIEQLPPRCREVFKLSRVQQMSYAEISEQLGISTNTVEVQVVKALKSLRVSLKDYLPVLFAWLLISK